MVPAKRMIVVLRSDWRTERYALHRFRDGSVAWRSDTFTAPEDPAEAERWIAYHGELTVAQVIEHVPDQSRAVLAWTRDEIDSGLDAADVEDPRARERRADSLERLSRELAAASARTSGR